MIKKLWDWATGSIPDTEYRLIRTAVGLGSALAFATWVQAAYIGKTLPANPVNTAYPGSVLWWILWILGITGSILLLTGFGKRAASLLVFLGLQACGGFAVNWAGLALISSAGVLVFAGGTSVPAWPKRLLQVQLPIGYLIAVSSKLLLSAEWRNLEAFENLTKHQMNKYLWPTIPQGLLSVFDATGIFLEAGAALFLAWGLFSKRGWPRKLGLVFSIILHLGISLFIPVGLFIFGVMPYWAASSKRTNVPRPLVWTGMIFVIIILLVNVGIDGNPFKVW